MSAVLTLASSVTCNHTGVVSTQGSSRLTVNGQGVLLKAGIEKQTVSMACTTVTNTNTGDVKCSIVNSVTAGESSRLTVDGNGVVLDTLAGQTNGMANKVQGSLQNSAVQTRLTVS
jgi:hypothetical protein